MKKAFTLWYILLVITLPLSAQSTPGFVVGNFNAEGDFLPLKPLKVHSLDLRATYPKFTQVKFNNKLLTLTYKNTGGGVSAVQYFDPAKNTWIELFRFDCCNEKHKGKLMIYEGKHFRSKSDVLVFYEESYDGKTEEFPRYKTVDIALVSPTSQVKQYSMTLNPLNGWPHKLIMRNMMIREHFGGHEDSYDEYALETKLQKN